MVYFQDKKGYRAHTVSFCLPFFILRCKTFLPPAVALRARYPCLRFPFNLVGVFKHFFIIKILAYIRKVSTKKGIVKNIAKKNYCGIITFAYRPDVNNL